MSNACFIYKRRNTRGFLFALWSTRGLRQDKKDLEGAERIEALIVLLLKVKHLHRTVVDREANAAAIEKRFHAKNVMMQVFCIDDHEWCDV